MKTIAPSFKSEAGKVGLVDLSFSPPYTFKIIRVFPSERTELSTHRR